MSVCKSVTYSVVRAKEASRIHTYVICNQEKIAWIIGDPDINESNFHVFNYYTWRDWPWMKIGMCGLMTAAIVGVAYRYCYKEDKPTS